MRVTVVTVGGHYGSIQFRADDRNEVLPILQSIASDGERRFLCGPSLNGWVGAYPSGNGQDERVAEACAARWPRELLYLSVHDDDLLVYRYFSGGKLRDAYWSRPGYFSESDRAEREAEAGAPETYAHLIVGGLERVRAVLDRGERNKRTFELERLLELGKLLRIVNAGTAYEYLEDGERRGIRGWKQFVHVPDRAGERGAARQAKVARDEVHARWKAEGILLAAQELPDPLTVLRRRTSPEVVIKVGQEKRSIDFDAPERGVSAHPVEPFRVLIRGDHIEIDGGVSVSARKLLVGSQSAKEARASDRSLELMLLGPTLAGLTPGQVLVGLLRPVPVERRATIEAHVRRVLPPPPWSNTQVQQLAQLVGSATNRSETVVYVSFSSDGRWLVCGTTRGLRVARWEDVARTPSDAPSPWRYSFDVPPHELVENPRHGYVYAALHDSSDDSVLFGGMDGRLRRMSLGDGHVEEVLEMYERAPVLQMKLLDRSMLATYVQPGFPVRRPRQGPKPLVYLWKYDAVRAREAAGVRPMDPPLEEHALVALAPDDEVPASPVIPILAALRVSHERAPEQVHLEALREDDWPDPAARDRLGAPLRDAGFRATGPFAVPEFPGMYLQFFAHPEHCIAGTLMRTSDLGTTLTLTSLRSDGSAFAFTSQPDIGLGPAVARDPSPPRCRGSVAPRAHAPGSPERPVDVLDGRGPARAVRAQLRGEPRVAERTRLHRGRGRTGPGARRAATRLVVATRSIHLVPVAGYGR